MPMGPSGARKLSFAASLVLSLVLTYVIVVSLSLLRSTVTPEIYLQRVALSLFAFFFPILGGWFAFRLVGGVLFALYAAVLVFFVGTVVSSFSFVWFLAGYALLCFSLYRLDQAYADQLAGLSVDREKFAAEKNDLERSFKNKGEGISILFEKYSTYYNLRKLAEEFATSLSVRELSRMAVKRVMEFLARGDMASMTLAETPDRALPVIACEISGSGDKNMARPSEGDLFDLWVIKNRRRLIVNDTHQDFRFDVKEAMRLAPLRSLIVAPLVNEGRTIGTLRVNAGQPGIFSNDDLRLLDTISVLASSAVSNGMLYEQTVELAIRDSLTGLYVRRHFFDRLKDEHRRALLTQRPLSILMCDIDHFKETNDRHGHAAGDLMLIRFSKMLSSISEHAIVSRYGGEEFAVLLPELGKAAALQLAEELRLQVEKEPFDIRREKIQLTVSIGVSCFPEDSLDLESFVQKADEALYQAKKLGRNKVCSSHV